MRRLYAWKGAKERELWRWKLCACTCKRMSNLYQLYLQLLHLLLLLCLYFAFNFYSAFSWPQYLPVIPPSVHPSICPVTLILFLHASLVHTIHHRTCTVLCVREREEMRWEESKRRQNRRIIIRKYVKLKRMERESGLFDQKERTIQHNKNYWSQDLYKQEYSSYISYLLFRHSSIHPHIYHHRCSSTFHFLVSFHLSSHRDIYLR